MRQRRRIRALAACALLLAAGLLASWGAIARHVRAARLLVGFEAPSEAIDGVEVTDGALASVRSRTYATSAGGPPVVLIHGVHAGGIDEPRLVHFARLLAEAGFTVATPEIEAMTRLVLDARSAIQVGAAATAFAERQGAPSVAMVGISFGGGLALIAAADRPASIHAVWAIGAPHDLTRLVQWWTGGVARGPDGERAQAQPESYGAAVLAYSFAEDFFAPEDLEAGRAILGARLRGELERSSDLRRDASATLEASLNAASHPGARIRALAERHRDVLEELSPAAHLGGLRARVYLLHGVDDPVVASSETLYLAREVPNVEGVLLTGLLGHAAATGHPSLSDRWQLVHHAAGALGALGEPRASGSVDP